MLRCLYWITLLIATLIHGINADKSKNIHIYLCYNRAYVWLLCSLFVWWWEKFQPYVSFVLLLWTWRDAESVELMTMNCLIRNSFLHQLQFPPVPHSNALISLPPAPWVVLCPAENRAAQEASAFHEEHEACSAFVTSACVCSCWNNFNCKNTCRNEKSALSAMEKSWKVPICPCYIQWI